MEGKQASKQSKPKDGYVIFNNAKLLAQPFQTAFV
jgi:hypothetical protein